MLTAEEARKLNPNRRLEEDIKLIEAAIRRAAEAGQTSCRAPYEVLTIQGYGAGFRTPEVGSVLTRAGYTLTERSEDRLFVDTWVEISWDNVESS